MNDDIAIKVSHVSKTFKLPHEKNSSIKGAVVNFATRKKSFEVQSVLKDVSFEIKKGEFFGIVGRNGSGKSTLLKLIAGIYEPSSGSIQHVGKLTPFIELGVGFNPELTGRENVFLNGALLGFNRREMLEQYDEIVAFAELERFMDQKLKNYSSGMQVRLAFSIAIRVQSDILIMDEVLAVGDAAFQKKCFEVFRRLKNQKQTIILVTHDMSNVERFCDRVLIVDKGSTTKLVDAAEAVATYNRLNYSAKKTDVSGHPNNSNIHLNKIELFDQAGKKQKIFNHGQPITLRIHVDGTAEVCEEKIIIGLAFYDSDDVNISGPNSHNIPFKVQDGVIDYTINRLPFAVGEYRIAMGIFDEYMKENYDFLDNAGTFFVNSEQTIHGKVTIDASWTIADAGKVT